MDSYEDKVSILALSWGPGGTSVGYAWFQAENSVLSAAEGPNNIFPWNEALKSQGFEDEIPTIYVGSFHGKNDNEVNYLHHLRLTTRPTMYLVAQKTKLPTLLTESLKEQHDLPKKADQGAQTGRILRAAFTPGTPASSMEKTISRSTQLKIPMVKVKYMHPVELSADTAREILSSMPPGRDTFDSNIAGQKKESELSCFVDTRSLEMMSALGGLFSHLQRAYPSLFPYHINAESQARYRVLPLQIESQVLLDHDTFRELEIFKREPHPASHQLIGSSKEGLSLFGIASCFCKTTKGAEALRDMFIKPTNDIRMLQSRQAKIKYLTDNQDFCLKLRTYIRHVDHPVAMYQRLRKGAHSPSDWQQICHIAKYYGSLLTMLHDDFHLCDSFVCYAGTECQSAPCTPINCNDTSVHTVPHAVQQWCDALDALVRKVNEVLDLAESMKANRLVIHKGYDEKLERLSNLCLTMPNFLTTVAQKEIEDLPSELALSITLSISYFPQFGYHVALPATTTPTETLDSLVAQLGWQKAFSTAEKHFFKNIRMQELDDQLGDVHGTLQDLEATIIRSLETHLASSHTLNHLFSPAGLLLHVGRIDALCALAQAASEYEWKAPQLSTEPIIRIQNGRHPLLPCTSWRPSVGNNTCFRSDHGPNVSMVTGANGSGKSIYLKQVALLSFLAHIGSFVPAEDMVIGPLSAIFTCIGSPMHRSFASDIARVGRMLHFPTHADKHRPLFCIDEFGKGTLAQDGVALLAAVIMNILNQNPSAMPFVAMTTHYTEIFRTLKSSVSPDIIEKYLEISVMSVFVADNGDAGAPSEQMSQDALCPDAADATSGVSRKDLAAVQYTYRKTPGINEQTYALSLARQCGIPPDILRHAESALHGLIAGKPLHDIIEEEKVHAEIEKAYKKQCEQKERLEKKYPHLDDEGLVRYIVQRNVPLVDGIIALLGADEAQAVSMDNLRINLQRFQASLV